MLAGYGSTGVQTDGSGVEEMFRLRGYKLLADVVQGIKFVNGVKQNGDRKQVAA